mgnify:CR=1 FL=1
MPLPDASRGPLTRSTVSTWPTVAPDDATLADAVFTLSGGNGLHVSGTCNADDGKLYLLRHRGGTTWVPVDCDAATVDSKAVAVDSTKLAGHFGVPFLTGDLYAGSSSAPMLLYQTGSATFSDLAVQGIRV